MRVYLCVYLRVRAGLWKGRDLTHAEQLSGVHILLVLGFHRDRAFHRHPLWSSSDIRGVRHLPEATEPVKSKPNWDSNLALPKAPSPLLSGQVLKVLPAKAGGTSITRVFGAPGGASPASPAGLQITMQMRKEGTHPWAPRVSWELTRLSLPPGSPRGSQQAKLSIHTTAFSLVSQSPRLTSPSQ